MPHCFMGGFRKKWCPPPWETLKSTVYFTKITTSKVGKYLKFYKTPGRALACLLAWYWQINFLCEFTENCFPVFDQSGRVILLTWYCWLHFFRWIACGYLVNGSVKYFLSNRRGVNIIHICSILGSFGSVYIFYFKA